VISRYSYWMGVPVIAAVTIAVDSLGGRRAQGRSALFVIVGGMSLLALWGLHGKDSSHVEFTWPARVAMEIFPKSYFPHPEIFCERVQKKEGCALDRAYVFRPPGHTPARVLVEEEFLVKQCDGKYPLERPVKAETFLWRRVLWFSGSRQTTRHRTRSSRRSTTYRFRSFPTRTRR